MSKQGQCLCGDVSFTATPKNNDVGVCHCVTCRKNNAGPFFAVDCGDSLKFENETKLGIYQSSDWAERLFCQSCGSSIAWRLRDKSINIVACDLLDDLGELCLDHEVFIDQKPEYYSFAQNTRQMTAEEVFAAFAKGQEEQ